MIYDIEKIGYREFGFGKKVNLNTCSYLIKIAKDKFVNLMESIYDECIEELRRDDEITGEFDPPFPGATGYPPLKVFIEEHKEAFTEFFRTYFEWDFLSLLLSNENEPIYVINSIDSIEITDSSVIVTGEAYKRKDVRQSKIAAFTSQDAVSASEMVLQI